MATFIIVVAAIAFGGSLGIDAVQNKTGTPHVPERILGAVLTGALAFLLVGIVVWAFTVDMPRPVALCLGVLFIAIVLWALARRTDDVAAAWNAVVKSKPTRLAPMPGADIPSEPDGPDGPAPAAPDGATEPDEGADPRRGAAAYIVGDDANTTVSMRKQPRDSA